MTDKEGATKEYSAKTAYQSGESLQGYEKRRFSGLLGRYRYMREQKAVASILSGLPRDATFVDCPCGTGRWWPLLLPHARSIIGMDISPGMRQSARQTAENLDTDIDIREGDAENLDLPSESVDYTFSFALTKHLPVPVQYAVLAEFARISRQGVISTFGVFSHLSYELWRRRNLAESYPVTPEELGWMATAAGLQIDDMRRCTTPIGIEHIVLFRKPH